MRESASPRSHTMTVSPTILRSIVFHNLEDMRYVIHGAVQLHPSSYGASADLYQGIPLFIRSIYASNECSGFQTTQNMDPRSLRTHRPSFEAAQKGKTAVELPSAYSDAWALLDEPRTLLCEVIPNSTVKPAAAEPHCSSVSHRQVGRLRRWAPDGKV